MRKLATIRVTHELFPINGADAIEAVRVDGWVCVAKKGEFQTGDRGVYFEIDSFLPGTDARYAFLEKTFIAFNGQRGARLRTIRLRGQLSQGLFLPMNLFPELQDLPVGSDVTDILGIEKWEPAIPTQLAGDVYGPMPSFLKTSDQERAQNLVQEIADNAQEVFERTIKLDGTSMTVYRYPGFFADRAHGVCGRNWELKNTEGNSLWRTALADKIFEALDFLGKNLAFQGELIGEGIQENPEKIKGTAFYIYDIINIDEQQFVDVATRHAMIKTLQDNGFKVKSVPFVDMITLNHSVEELLALADGPSLNPKEKREGLVYKRVDGQFSFKTISNWYLEKHKNR